MKKARLLWGAEKGDGILYTEEAWVGVRLGLDQAELKFDPVKMYVMAVFVQGRTGFGAFHFF